MRTARSSERGAALITALVLLVVIGSVSTMILEHGRGVARDTELERTRLRLLYAAEGGLEHLRHSLAAAPDHRGAALRIGTCDVTTTATELPDAPRRWQVRAVATCPAPGGTIASHRLDAVLRRTTGLPIVER